MFVIKVQELMSSCKQSFTTTKKKSTKGLHNTVTNEFLHPGDITEFYGINLYSNLIYVLVLSTSYADVTNQKSITTTFSSFIQINQVIRRVRTTRKTNRIVEVPCE